MARKTKEEALETRNRILDAAEIVFQRNGVSRTTLADIASEAHATRGAIYWHFENKVDLYDAMIQRIVEPLEQKLEELQRHQDHDPLNFIRSLALFYLDSLANDPHYYRVLEIAWHKCEYVGDMARIRDQHLECGNRFLGIKESAIRSAIVRGHLPGHIDARQAAVGLMAIIDGLVAGWTLDRQRFPLSSMAAGVIDTYLAGLAAQAKNN
ncbi:MAG TPA: TetR family transcriptional regulator [Methylophilaceae bacterium]|nr:TetR family transcriptional regulator [Methylophilaceae bacterium]HQR60898.1 TetR family transcriptional regulator [Methylophilaceae bacterium]